MSNSYCYWRPCSVHVQLLVLLLLSSAPARPSVYIPTSSIVLDLTIHQTIPDERTYLIPATTTSEAPTQVALFTPCYVLLKVYSDPSPGWLTIRGSRSAWVPSYAQKRGMSPSTSTFLPSLTTCRKMVNVNLAFPFNLHHQSLGEPPSRSVSGGTLDSYQRSRRNSRSNASLQGDREGSSSRSNDAWGDHQKPILNVRLVPPPTCNGISRAVNGISRGRPGRRVEYGRPAIVDVSHPDEDEDNADEENDAQTPRLDTVASMRGADDSADAVRSSCLQCMTYELTCAFVSSLLTMTWLHLSMTSLSMMLVLYHVPGGTECPIILFLMLHVHSGPLLPI